MCHHEQREDPRKGWATLVRRQCCLGMTSDSSLPLPPFIITSGGTALSTQAFKEANAKDSSKLFGNWFPSTMHN